MILYGQAFDGYDKHLFHYRCFKCRQLKSFIYVGKTFHHKGLCRNCATGKHTRKAVAFRYYLSKKIETSYSITAFCNKHPELGSNAKYHFTEVLKGKRLHYKGWLLGLNKVNIDLEKVKIIKQTLLRRAVSAPKLI